MRHNKRSTAYLSLLATTALSLITVDAIAQGDIEDIVTVGTRSKGRTVTSSPVPVDVLSEAVAKVEYPGLDLSHLWGREEA